MKKLMVACAVATLSGCVMPGMPGMDPTGGMDNAAMASEMDAQQASMMAAQTQAQAAAARPGDEAMSCDALQAEMAATMDDPKVQASMASMGASAQAQMDKAKAAQAGAVAGAATTTALGVASSFVPGLSWFSQGAMMAQQAQMTSQMNAANKDRAQMIADMNSVMPQLYRGQHLYDIATRKNCAFTKQPPA
jgi:hypothetical protein